MKRLIIIAGLTLIIATSVWLYLCSSSAEQAALEKTRQELRRQGFKLDLSEFDFSQPAEMRARTVALTGNQMNATPRSWLGQSIVFPREDLELMKVVGKESVLPIWKGEHHGAYGNKENTWGLLRELFHENEQTRAAMAQAANSGPYAFDLAASQGRVMRLPHLAWVKNLCDLFADRAMLCLHDQDLSGGWANLMTATRLVTGWQCEPVEVSLAVRCQCAQTIYEAAWEALQTNAWSDEQLLALQREWEKMDFFKELPEAVAFDRASITANARRVNIGPISSTPVTLQQILHAPVVTWQNFRYGRKRKYYMSHGFYEDEKQILLYFCDREMEVRRAIQCATWANMSAVPGITNPPPLKSLVADMSAWRSMVLNRYETDEDFRYYGLKRAAVAETHKRLVIIATALHRYRLHYNCFPESLTNLMPDYLVSLPVDFMDGKPMHYRRTDPNNFVLYSVGFNRVDDGGEMKAPASQGRFGYQEPPDIVWPACASAEEIRQAQIDELKAHTERKNERDEQQTQLQWDWTRKRQARLSDTFPKLNPTTPEPMFHGGPLTQTLGNDPQNNPTLSQMLALHQILTGAEPETVTFEVPVNYDSMTNQTTQLSLLVDPGESDEPGYACNYEVQRATNGDCLLVWHTIYETPGRHALQAGIAGQENVFAVGPGLPFTVSNLCQFSTTSETFDPDIGASFRIKLPESNGTYAAEMKLTNGQLLKTITGSTSNGVIKFLWDLKDENGRRMTNNWFDSFFTITLTDSGRTQHLRGP